MNRHNVKISRSYLAVEAKRKFRPIRIWFLSLAGVDRWNRLFLHFLDHLSFVQSMGHLISALFPSSLGFLVPLFLLLSWMGFRCMSSKGRRFWELFCTKRAFESSRPVDLLKDIIKTIVLAYFSVKETLFLLFKLKKILKVRGGIDPQERILEEVQIHKWGELFLFLWKLQLNILISIVVLHVHRVFSKHCWFFINQRDINKICMSQIPLKHFYQ